jgi:hypothetical protein
MDQGTGRSIADMIKSEHGHVKNANVVSSISRWMAFAPEVRPDFLTALKHKVAAGAALEAFNHDAPDIIRAAEMGVHFNNTTLAVSPTAMGYCWLQFIKVDEEATHAYFYAFTELAFAPQGDPRKAAYQRIVKIMGDVDAKAGNWTSAAIVSVITRSWNAWREDIPMDAIMIKSQTGLIPPVQPK